MLSLRALEALFRKKGYDVVGLDSPITATQKLATEDFDVALLDIKMPQLSGLELLNAVKHRRPEIEVIMMTGHGTIETAVEVFARAGESFHLRRHGIDLFDCRVRCARYRPLLWNFSATNCVSTSGLSTHSRSNAV